MARLDWEESQAEAKKLEAQGFWVATDPPPMCPASAQAHHCWAFCGGWNPQALPVYAALHHVHDWHQMIDLMSEIRRYGH